MPKRKQKLVLGFLVLLFLVNFLTWSAVYNLSQTRFLEVNFFNVGQGDAVFIETPQRHQILIDGGPNSTILEKLGSKIPFWDRTIDLIILTHPEYDHLAGLIEVLKRYKVKNILWTGVVRETADGYEEWVKSIKDEKANLKIAQAGQRIILARTVLAILYPFENLEGQEFKDSNNTSIAAKLVFGENSFLFTGDIYKSAERKLLDKDIASGVLKVAHHGSKTSSAEEFIERVSPEIAIILAGKDNKYGHPHQEVLDILNKFGINVLRTDKNGDIKIISDGKTYELSHFQNEN